MICIICEHDCHCNDICQAGNGCGCSTCEHQEEVDTLKKIWKRILNWFK
jgi:hypothetical protein